LLRRLNTGQNLLDPNANLRTARRVLNLANGASHGLFVERAGALEHVHELLLRVDVRDRDLGVKPWEQVELLQD